MISFTEIHPGFDIAHNVYRDEALQIASELAAIDDVFWMAEDKKGKHYSLASPKDAQPYTAEAEEEARDHVAKIHADLWAIAYDITGYPNRTSVNKYVRKGSGVWHDDYLSFLPVYVLGLVDIQKPSFEYAPAQTPQARIEKPDGKVFGISISAGDVLRVSSSIVHRGINPTRSPRYTGAMSRDLRP